jgi:lysophospholipase L1-like esterase
MASKPSAARAIKLGKDLAAEALARRRSAEKTRKAAVARLVQAAPGKAAPRKVARGKIAASPAMRAPSHSAGTLICEGDSWFDYPFHDVLKQLEDVYAYEIETVAHKGDCVEEMAYSGGQLDDFTRRVAKVLRSGVSPKAILLSGGGNDIAGDEFAILLNHAASGKPGLNDSIVTGVIDERLFDAYVAILSAVNTICKDMVGRVIPVVLHGYDYPVPDGRGFGGGFGPLPGPWLEPGFRVKGYSDMPTRKGHINTLIDRFNVMVGRVAKLPAFANVTHLDLRQTLSNGADYKTWWANELHPTKEGFDVVAAKYAAVIK